MATISTQRAVLDVEINKAYVVKGQLSGITRLADAIIQRAVEAQMALGAIETLGDATTSAAQDAAVTKVQADVTALEALV